MELKPEVTNLNFIFVLIMRASSGIIFTFVFNLLIFLAEDQYGVKKKDIGRVIGDLGFYAELAIILFSPLIGIATDLIGRKEIVVIGISIAGASIAIMSVGEKVYPTLVILKILA